MIRDVITGIRIDMDATYAKIYDWLNVPHELMNYSPENGGWNIREELEHISMTNHLVLIGIRKGVEESLEKSAGTDYTNLLAEYDFDWNKLQTVATDTYDCDPPRFMQPAGRTSLPEIRKKLFDQYDEFMKYLELLRDGQGVLHKRILVVNDLGMVDLYHYIYFLTQHADRHIAHMQKVKEEFTLRN